MALTVFVGVLMAAILIGTPIAYAPILCGVALMWLLGLFDGRSPRHAKRFAEAGQIMREAVAAYVSDVESGAFPTDAQSSKKMEDGALDEALGSIYGAGA